MSLKDFYSGKTLLITGATGFLGKYILFCITSKSISLISNRQGCPRKNLQIFTIDKDYLHLCLAESKHTSQFFRTLREHLSDAIFIFI